MNSDWNTLKQQSNYHFDSNKNDKMVDKIEVIGKLKGNLTDHNKIKSLFNLANSKYQVVTHNPSEVETLHISDFRELNVEQPWMIKHIIIHATDWKPGQFYSFGNHVHVQWKAGDVFTFDWQNLPHCFANAGHEPCVVYKLTGTLTEQSNEFINRLKRFSTYELDPE